MRTTKNIVQLFVIIAVLFLQNSCKKKADQPPLHSNGNKSYSVPELKAIASCTGTCSKRFTDDVYFTGVVIADQVSGNFYKEIYVRDRYNTGAIHLDLKASAYYFFIGDSIRLLLKGYDIGYNSTSGMLEIDSVDFDNSVVIFAHGATPQPIDISISSNYSNYLCDLVRINEVGFIPADTNQMYADAINQASVNRTLQDCAGKQLIVRTSPYANFAQQHTPKGYGSIIGIATAYGTTNQLVIRKTSEINMNGSGCVVYMKKDFNDNSLTSGGWSQQSVVDPSVLWSAYTYSSTIFAKISGFYSSANHNAENWLISPAMNLSASTNPVLSFMTAAKFAGNNLEVLVSTNYTSGAPGSATWTQLSGFNLSPNTGNYVWTASGPLSLSSFKNANTRIAFRYTSTTSASTTYEVDDIIVMEN